MDALRNKLMTRSVTVPGLPSLLFFLTCSEAGMVEVGANIVHCQDGALVSVV
jgi:hypothetical protein